MADDDEILWRRIRPHTEGKRIAIVTNRDDRQLKDELQRRLGAKIKWVLAKPRKIGALTKSIRDGNYGMVIAFTGWIKHKTDANLSSAARKSKTTYVRADKGRPRACLLAIAREVGVDLT